MHTPSNPHRSVHLAALPACTTLDLNCAPGAENNQSSLLFEHARKGISAHAGFDGLVDVNAPADIPLGDQSFAQVSGPSESHALGKLVLIAGLVWIAILTVGFFVLAREEFTPVTGAAASPIFPPSSALALAPDVPTLILFVHPRCPCTRASLHELADLMVSLPNRVAVTIVFTLPKGVGPHWEQGELWQEAATIPGVHVTTDPDGQEAGRFGVKGSGHALLYQPSGQLVFTGGITPSRGHEGDNPGRSAIVSLVLQGRSFVDHTPVYGCPLLDSPISSSQP